jgi:hypothetical protein
MTLADDFTSFSVFFDYYVTLYVSTVELEGHLRCFGTVSEMLLNMVMFSLCVVIVKNHHWVRFPKSVALRAGIHKKCLLFETLSAAGDFFNDWSARFSDFN